MSYEPIYHSSRLNLNLSIIFEKIEVDRFHPFSSIYLIFWWAPPQGGGFPKSQINSRKWSKFRTESRYEIKNMFWVHSVADMSFKCDLTWNSRFFWSNVSCRIRNSWISRKLSLIQLMKQSNHQTWRLWTFCPDVRSFAWFLFDSRGFSHRFRGGGGPLKIGCKFNWSTLNQRREHIFQNKLRSEVFGYRAFHRYHGCSCWPSYLVI